ncbi:sigma-70 family RNA polymerase sigma factor [Myxococcus sp. K38C18041901]|uniref:RNA polymerase sigma factor n=1 Tax=Myxococcus guangdongensis TaxID=2906760 RepID=UPI0020A78B21|nr:sigma-70 family RNA polymerase sigma factor [Myxococcus guangdongensis]MCP3057325.1 sigma-70 family RNA polymerase sigma factor [Myxococcus guangdongensis]
MTAPRQPALRVIQGGPLPDRRDFLRELYTRYGGSVMGRCRYLLKDAAKAEDAMHDVFARALSHADDFRADASPLTWLMKIATHHCLNQLRSERAGWRQWFERDAAARSEGHGGDGEMETRDLVRRLLSKVDEETQAAVVHYHVDGMTLEEVAALLGRSVPTIRKRLERFAELGGEELRVR